MTARRVAAALLLYVVPLGVTAGLLVAVGLPRLAVGLLVIEACVAVAVALARRPRRQAAAQPRDGSTVVLVIGGAVVTAVLTLLVLLRTTAG